LRDILRRLQRGEITLDEAQAAIEVREVTPSKPAVSTTVRREAARPEGAITAIFMALVVLEVLFASMFLWGLLEGWSQRPLALLLAAMFLILGVLTDIYRTAFTSDRLIIKRRRDKVVPRQD
jgi:protein-S-isoprenylcysteine O-methyltransferase Ste14